MKQCNRNKWRKVKERKFKTIMDTIWIISLILSAAQKSASKFYFGKN